jgi:carboxyl-terminal processing protease
MLPACNKGVGMNMGFPDVCLTPAGPAVVPIPYPNMAMHAMAAPFAPNVLLSMMPALNMGSIIPMTLGDSPGVANPVFMQMGQFTMGDPVVMINGLPGVSLTSPTSGNMMNNPVGMVQVPSVTNVFFSLAGAAPGAAAVLDAVELAALGAALDVGSPVDGARLLGDGVAYARIGRFTAAVPSAIHHVLTGLAAEGMEALILDLRGNPGGDALAAIALAGDFLEPGSLVAVMVDGDGDETRYHARCGQPHRFPLAILVDGGTASAAEIFAGSLQAHGRAVLVGETTYGKGVAQAVVPSPSGPRYETVASFVLPGDRALQGAGLRPDVESSGSMWPTPWPSPTSCA